MGLSKLTENSRLKKVRRAFFARKEFIWCQKNPKEPLRCDERVFQYMYQNWQGKRKHSTHCTAQDLYVWGMFYHKQIKRISLQYNISS